MNIIDKKVIVEIMCIRGWSQNELARRVGVSKGTMSKVINGKRGTGRKVLAGLLKAIPETSYDLLIENKN